MKKLNVAVLFGGRSAEHEVSLLSAQNVVAALDPEKYNPILIGIDREGQWFLNEGSMHLLDAGDVTQIRLKSAAQSVALLANGPSSALLKDGQSFPGTIDVIFPVLHGPYGEDGTIQGLARLANIPCVGANVLGSAIGMDKDVMKRLLRDASIPIAPFRVAHAGRVSNPALANPTFEEVRTEFGVPLYIKPANLGSSVGISRVGDTASYQAGLELAFAYDRKVIIEQAITGREIECSVLGNDEPIASVAGEVIPEDGFYSYEAKYVDENGATLEIPARVTATELETIQSTAIRAFQTLCCAGMARVDGFLEPSGRFVVNEINTIPGFTGISMYPKLFEASGLSQTDLLDRLIELAIERHSREQALKLKP